MKLSTKGRYGLRAMLDLAANGGGEAVSIASIAKRQDLSVRYLEQLFRKLRTAGLIESVRGASGGYRLAKEPDAISVGEVLRALEGDLVAVQCDGMNESCANADACISKIVWERINTAISESVDSLMLSDLIAEQTKASAGLLACGQA